LRTVEKDIEACRAKPLGGPLEVIIEAAYHRRREGECVFAGEAAGADYSRHRRLRPKWRDGRVAPSCVVVGSDMGVKAAGGVRDLEGLRALVAAGLASWATPAQDRQQTGDAGGQSSGPPRFSTKTEANARLRGAMVGRRIAVAVLFAIGLFTVRMDSRPQNPPSQAPSRSSGAVVLGKVSDGPDGAGISEALVRMYPRQGSGASSAVWTDALGQFVFFNIADGAYDLGASTLVTRTYGQRAP
jgi:hypothetical protein